MPDGRSDARHALTRYAVLERFGEKPDSTAVASLVECRLETGRTHQVRVHMASIGHPLLGDPVYGRGRIVHNHLLNQLDFKRQALHASRLKLVHPVTHREVEWEAPLPADMADLIAFLESDQRVADWLSGGHPHEEGAGGHTP